MATKSKMAPVKKGAKKMKETMTPMMPPMKKGGSTPSYKKGGSMGKKMK